MVTAAKPAVGGAISVAPTTATMPTSTGSGTPEGFTSLGYISDAGVVRSRSKDSTIVKAWGGDVVLAVNSGMTETFKFTMLDSTNLDVLKLVYGDGNVTGSASAGITVTSNNAENVAHEYCIDMVESGSTLHRITIPSGVVTAVGDVSYLDSGAVSYEVTVTAVADDDGNTAYDYIKG